MGIGRDNCKTHAFRTLFRCLHAYYVHGLPVPFNGRILEHACNHVNAQCPLPLMSRHSLLLGNHREKVPSMPFPTILDCEAAKAGISEAGIRVPCNQ